MKRKTIFTHIFVPQAAILLLTLFAAGGWALRGARQEHHAQTRGNLQSAARMLADFLNRSEAGHDAQAVDIICKQIGKAAGYRFTVVLSSGKVVGDTDENPQVMDNHYFRPEIRDLHGQPNDAVGWSTRSSGTMRMNMMYVAVPWIDDGERLGFVRAARAMGDIDLALARQRLRMIYAGMWLGLLVVAVSALLAGRFSKPIARIRREVESYIAGDPDLPDLKLPSSSVREIHVLSEAMNIMSRRLKERIGIIIRQRDEQNALLSCMREAVIATDAQGRVLSMNPAAKTIFMSDSGDITGKPIQEVVRNADVHSLWQNAMRGSAPIEAELSVPEREITLQGSAAAMLDGYGRRIGCVMVMSDITRLRRLETMRRDFVANVSHELKTPVTSISGFAETLLDGAAEDVEDRTRFLQIIRRQARRLTTILEDLLTLSRIEHELQQAGITLQSEKIRTLFESAVKFWQESATEKGMMLVVECEPEIKAPLNLQLMEQAVTNLVGNAVKYGMAGSRVMLSAEQKGSTLVLSVTDEGPGIAKHHLPRLFERFYRVDKGRSREMGGTGLGLAIVKSVAIAHGGRVDVNSTPGKGSVFSIHIPISGYSE